MKIRRVYFRYAGLVLFLAFAALLCSKARAETKGNWSYGPSVAASVVAVNLRTGSYSTGLNAAPALGACLGVTYLPLDLGADICGNVQLNKDTPNQYSGAGMLHWRDWLNGGLGLSLTQGQPLAPLLLIGGRWGFLQAGAKKTDEADKPAERWE